MDQQLLPKTKDMELAIGLSNSARRNRWLRRLVWTAIIVGLAAAGYYIYQARQQQAQAVTYDTVPVERRNLTVSVTATGTIQPLMEVEVGSELSGVAREVLVEENDIVKQGDVLARLDTTRLTAQKAKAEAQVEGARARILTAQASLNQANLANTRQSRLRARSLSTEQEAEQTEAEMQRAQASLSATRADLLAAQADLELVAADLAKSTIVSPINGIVLKRTLEPGQTVAASLQAPILFTLAQDISRIQLEAAVDEADVGTVKVGQPASFSVDAYRGQNFPARIERMSFSPETVDGIVTYKTILSADNASLALRPGMTAVAKITVAQHDDVLAVPNEALRYTPPRVQQSLGFSITQIFMPRFPRNERSRGSAPEDGSRNLYILENNAPKLVPVKVGATDGKFTIVSNGDLKTGDQLITASRQGTVAQGQRP
jgi:HlyD family secretion protein